MTTTPSRTSADTSTPVTGSGVGRVLLALSAVLGPLLFLAAFSVQPYETTDSTKEIVAAIAENESAVQFAQWAMALGLILLVLGTLAVGLLATARSPKLGLWGTAVLATGWLAIATTPNLDQVALGGLEKGVGQEALVAVTDGTYELAVNGIPTLYFVAAHVIGAILLGVALLRGRAIAPWAAWALILSMPVNVVGFVAGLLPVVLLSFALMAVGFGAAGLVILRRGTGWIRSS
ncbi:hypothetical protein [Streptomyces aurantiogriseus]|uniref:DUF4386 family protein n=1 Tax=Streptomyces aurantiogriseus TaxID=66870 RepID=A0A918F2A6_9ACTN|nr:hypothetical protein [Streptomyces aurantiogriseus]GGR01487.1 hypothetical protein GCM10010251_16370 [Streptomyces aurantiogriseus]